MSLLIKGVQSVLGGQVSFARAAREAFRRGRATVSSRRERALLDGLASQPVELRPEYQSLTSSDLLQHFRQRTSPVFFPGFEQKEGVFGGGRLDFSKTLGLITSANNIVKNHRWPLLGFGEKEFGSPINWLRDPLSGRLWPLDYHADIPLWHHDGSDIRALWELNRLGHVLTLGRAYALSKLDQVPLDGKLFVVENEDFDTAFFAQVESWHEQNPVGRGANWACAMEVALRAMNLLAAFTLFRSSPKLTEARLMMLLAMFDQHGSHIRRNLEFSHLATSNHYLSDVAGLLWLGLMLPELSKAEEWLSWSYKELLRELDKQILPDGADYESSTGYHRFALELLLYSLVLCRDNRIRLYEEHWNKLEGMLLYLRSIIRPDGLCPLIGDTDGSQVLPIHSRKANDHGYLLTLGAAVLKDARFIRKPPEQPEELSWFLGPRGVSESNRQLHFGHQENSSQGFSHAGTYVLRHQDLYLLFNANGAKNGRPASHRHNDVLSFEVSAGGRAFIVDPGSFVYTADLQERHLFRSTAYHSTVQIDDAEQNNICTDTPFKIGNEARVKVLSWKNNADYDRIEAEHSGYERLPQPVTHRRAVTFDKTNRGWLVEDELIGNGEHKVVTRFHFDAGLNVRRFNEHSVIAIDEMSSECLIVCSLDLRQAADLEPQFTSRQYGSKEESISAGWTTKTSLPCKLRWALVPVAAGEDQNERLRVLSDL